MTSEFSCGSGKPARWNIEIWSPSASASPRAPALRPHESPFLTRASRAARSAATPPGSRRSAMTSPTMTRSMSPGASSARSHHVSASPRAPRSTTSRRSAHDLGGEFAGAQKASRHPGSLQPGDPAATAARAAGPRSHARRRRRTASANGQRGRRRPCSYVGECSRVVRRSGRRSPAARPCATVKRDARSSDGPTMPGTGPAPSDLSTGSPSDRGVDTLEDPARVSLSIRQAACGHSEAGQPGGRAVRRGG
jgi:hypothetical protein